jgi:hypothetical protein
MGHPPELARLRAGLTRANRFPLGRDLATDPQGVGVTSQLVPALSTVRRTASGVLKPKRARSRLPALTLTLNLCVNLVTGAEMITAVAQSS